MPRPSTRISIPAPCTQNWEQMTPAAQGRHCQTCQQPVIDFSQLSDAEVVALLAGAPAATCGRFAARQLDRPLLGAVPPPPRWRTWLMAATALVASLLTTVGARAQVPAPDVPGAQPQPARPTTTPPLPDPHGVTIRGHVFDQATKQPVPFAALGFKSLDMNTLSKEDGSFEFKVSASQLAAHPADTLVVQSLGYQHNARLTDLRGAAERPIGDMQISLLQKDVLFTTGLLIIDSSQGSRAQPVPKQKRRNSRR